MSIQALTGKTRIAGIFGWPVDHSRSPRLHGYWLHQFKIDGAYIPFATHPSKLEQGIRALTSLGFRGGNITLPHKERALGFVDDLTPVAKRIGAINMLVVREDGTILGDNSDGFGFIANLQQVQPSWRGNAGPAVLLGAGGAARAIVVSLLDAGAPEIRLINRTTRRAEEIAEAVGGPITVLPWEERHDAIDGVAMLVNATSQGMVGEAALDLKLDRLPKGALVSDIIYNPGETPLLVAAKARGNRTVGGLGMLLHQGRPAWKAWFGIDPKVTPELRALIEATM
jgi:shikimate dehydrogenase